MSKLEFNLLHKIETSKKGQNTYIVLPLENYTLFHPMYGFSGKLNRS